MGGAERTRCAAWKPISWSCHALRGAISFRLSTRCLRNLLKSALCPSWRLFRRLNKNPSISSSPSTDVTFALEPSNNRHLFIYLFILPVCFTVFHFRVVNCFIFGAFNSEFNSVARQSSLHLRRRLNKRLVEISYRYFCLSLCLSKMP